MDDKVKRATTYYGLDEKIAKKEIEKINKQRENHYKYYTGKNWRDFTNYDVCINSDALGVERTAEVICELVNEKEKSLV